MSQDITAKPHERSEPAYNEDELGIAGRTARFFIRSPPRSRSP